MTQLSTTYALERPIYNYEGYEHMQQALAVPL